MGVTLKYGLVNDVLTWQTWYAHYFLRKIRIKNIPVPRYVQIRPKETRKSSILRATILLRTNYGGVGFPCLVCQTNKTIRDRLIKLKAQWPDESFAQIIILWELQFVMIIGSSVLNFMSRNCFLRLRKKFWLSFSSFYAVYI